MSLIPSWFEGAGHYRAWRHNRSGTVLHSTFTLDNHAKRVREYLDAAKELVRFFAVFRQHACPYNPSRDRLRHAARRTGWADTQIQVRSDGTDKSVTRAFGV